jgi:cob(I)alamin adenosyltransferase
MHKLEKGYVHIYTGDGKGKTTAALGMTLRAAGAGLKVLIIQFMKGQHYSEITALEKLAPLVEVIQTGRSHCIRREEVEAIDREEAMKGIYRARQALEESDFDMLILDEILVAHWFGLVSTKEILSLITDRPAHIELVLTGRRAPAEIVQRADLVTEMLDIKHYYTSGVQARKGIES